MYLRLLAIVIFFSACCTKKYCVIPGQDKEIKILYKGFTMQELDTLKLYLTANDYTILDSVNGNLLGNGELYIFDGLFSHHPSTMGQYNYISLIANRRDTISGIAYDEVHEKIKCNQCFPAGDGRSDVTRITNFRFDHNGQTVNADSLVIVK